MPLTAFAFVIGGLSLIGVPGTAGFVSKWLLIGSLMESGTDGLIMVAIVVVSSLMAVAYIWRVVETIYFKEPEQTNELGEAPWPMLFIAWAAIAMNIYFGLQPDLAVTLSESAAVVLLGGGA